MVLENQLRRDLVEIGCPGDAFSVISDFSKTRLSEAFSGKRDLPGPELTKLLSIVKILRQLREDARPYPLNFRDAMAIRALLHDYRQGKRWVPIEIGGNSAREDLIEAKQ